MQPRVIVVHPSRGPINVDEATARRVMSGEISRWSELDQPRGPVHLLTSGSPRDRITTVAHHPNALTVVAASHVDPRVYAVSVAGVDPLSEPKLYPILGRGQQPPAPITVTVVGDVMMARGVADAMGAHAFEPLRSSAPHLRAANLTIGNLESSLSQNGRPTQGTDSFAADPKVLSALNRAGFDILSLANNHVGDFGTNALQQTLNAFRGSHIERVGAGSTAREARHPAVVDVGGVRIGVLAFNSIGESPAAGPATPGVVQLRMPPRTGPLNRHDLAALTNSVAKLKGRVDIVLVIPHWGDQYTGAPLPVQRRVAARLVHAGATAVIGGHPHWVQGLEMVGNSLVAYSTGNFIFDMDFSRPTMQGIGIDLTFWGDRLMAATPAPVAIAPDFSAHFVGGRRGAQILDDVWPNSYGSFAS
jgi:poly-gamma-glutamate synthesis protein (capsule biosynthesis protein)